MYIYTCTLYIHAVETHMKAIIGVALWVGLSTLCGHNFENNT